MLNQRPICKTCNKNHVAINYKRDGVTEAYVTNVAGRRISKNHKKPIGLRVVIRKKPHVIYVASRVYLVHK